MRMSEKLLTLYTKEQLVALYDQHHNIYKVADVVGCDYSTLIKIFKKLEVPVGKFCHKPLVSKKLSHLTRESLEKLLRNHTIDDVARLNDSHRGQIVARMREVGIPGNRKRPQHRNQAISSIPEEVFRELVEFYGVLGLSRELKCSQSAIRDRANRLEIALVGGPHKALTSTSEWLEMCRQNGLNTNIQLGKTGFKNTSIEIAVQEYFKSKNIPFELHPKIINLTVPDAFIAPNICIYVDGCYWHGCPTCKVADKNSGLAYTKTHDNFVNKQLVKAGYRVIRIWEHSVKIGDFSALDSL